MTLNGEIKRALDLDTLEIQGAEGRTLSARLLRWNVENEVSDDGRSFYPEVWERGSFAVTIQRAQQLKRNWPLFVNHQRQNLPAGAIMAVHERDDGPWMTAKISKTQHGNEVIELINDGALPTVSIGATAIRSRKVGRAVHRMEVALREVSLTPFPQLDGAEVMALRSSEAATRYMDELDEYLKKLKS